MKVRPAHLRRPLAALFAAASAAFALSVVEPGPAPAVRVLTAARDLPGGTKLRAADVRRTVLTPGSVPAGALRSGAVGRVLAGPMRRGEPLTDARFVGGDLLRGHHGSGAVATPVRIADADAVRLVRAGDRIDVLAASFENPAGTSPVATRDPLPDATDPDAPDRLPTQTPGGTAPDGTSRSTPPASGDLSPGGLADTPPNTPGQAPPERTPRPPSAPPDRPPSEGTNQTPPESTGRPPSGGTAGTSPEGECENPPESEPQPQNTGTDTNADSGTGTDTGTGTGTNSGSGSGTNSGSGSGTNSISGSGLYPSSADVRRATVRLHEGRGGAPCKPSFVHASASPQGVAGQGAGAQGAGVRVVVSSVPVVAVPQRPADGAGEGALLVLATDRAQAVALAGAGRNLSITITGHW